VVRGIQDSREAVLLAAEPALAAVVDLGRVARRRGDVRGAIELDEGRTEDETLDVQRRKGDEVRVRLGRASDRDGEDGVANLLDIDRAAERGLLRIITFEPDTGWEVGDVVGRGGWMVAFCDAESADVPAATRTIRRSLSLDRTQEPRLT